MSAVALQSFDFGEQRVRAFDRNGQAWFVANDICAALELGNSRQAVSRLDDDERDSVITNDAIGRERQTTIISEPGVFSLTLTSRKASAKALKRLVTHEILPTLRLTGRYEMPGASPPDVLQLDAPDEFERLKAKLTIVREARMAFGREAARRAWVLTGLPDVSSDTATMAPAALALLSRSIRDWVDARCDTAPGHRERSTTLYGDYVDWAKQENVSADEILSLRTFGKMLSDCGVAALRSNVTYRVGLRLRAA